VNKAVDENKEKNNLEVITHSPAETIELARKLGALLDGGEVLALDGEMGAGKTHFIKGLALGLEFTDHVSSPTFNLIHEYIGGRLPLYHFDVYRLEDPAELEGLGYEEYFYGNGVTAIEWSGIIKDYLPEEYLHISFENILNGSSYTRRISFKAVGPRMEKIIEALKQEVTNLC